MSEIAQKLNYYKNGTTSCKLYSSTSDVGSDYLSVRANGSTAYAQLVSTSDSSASSLRVRKGGTTYAVATQIAVQPFLEYKFNSSVTANTGNGYVVTYTQGTIEQSDNSSPESETWCGKFTGGNFRILPQNYSMFDLSTNAWTIEFWEYRTNVGNYRSVFINSDRGSHGLILNYNRPSYLSCVINGADTNLGSIEYDVWRHWAYTRDTGTNHIRVYKNGSQIAAISIASATAITHPGEDWALGFCYLNNTYYTGYIDLFRVYINYCKYPNGTSFTAPTS